MQENQAFTCIGRGHGAPVRPAGAELWLRARKEPWLKTQCAKIDRLLEQGASEDAIKAEKGKLWVWTPHCAAFRGNHRSVADAERPLRRLMMDFDQKGHTTEIMQRLTSLEHPSPLTVLLIEESVCHGTHVLVELPDGMSPEVAQRLMQEATGFLPDPAVKDVARCIYMVPEEYTRYVSERLWGITDNPENPENPENSDNPENPENPDNPPLFKGLPYATIIAEYWLRTGGEPDRGERNTRLHQLAANLRAICDNSEDWLMQLMPRYGLSEQEMRAIVHSACKEPTKGSRIMQDIVKALSASTAVTDELQPGTAQDAASEDTSLAPATADHTQALLPQMLPIGLRDSLVGVPTEMGLPVLCAVMPLAAAYADAVEVEYCDGNRQRLGLMSIIRGEQASGKSVCKNAVDVWKRQFDQEDAQARRREEQWKERRKARKANEKAPEDPHVLIRMVPVTVSCSTLLKRLKNAGGHTLYSFGEELDTLRKTNGAGSWSSKYDIYRLSFDRGEWGQDYNSDQAESGVVNVAYNWTLLGTNGALRKCFKTDNIENGLSSRILVAEMPDSSFAKMPRFGRRTPEDEARIQEAVTRLRTYSGFIDTPLLRQAIDQWVEQKRVEAAKDIDHVMDTYRKRAAVIGFRCGVLHYLLSTTPAVTDEDTPTADATAERIVPPTAGEPSSSIQFALLMADYTLQQQMAAFGEAMRNQCVEARDEGQRNSVNHTIFDQLPPTFTRSELRALKEGTTPSGLRNIIMRWKQDGWIQPLDDQHFQKTSRVPASQRPIKGN